MNTRPDGRLIADRPIDILIDHIDYIVREIGIDHVALGSDFDGGQMPQALRAVDKLPHLIDALESRGYTPEAIEKIAHCNWFRVLRTTWQ